MLDMMRTRWASCEYIILCNCGGRIIWAVLKFYKGRKEAEKRPERLLWIGLTRFKQQAATTTFEINVYARLREIAEVILVPPRVQFLKPFLIFKTAIL